MNYLPSSSSDKRMTIDLERTRVRAESRILVAFVPLDESLNVTRLRINSDAVDCWKWAICNYSVFFRLVMPSFEIYEYDTSYWFCILHREK